jgi:pimeloyl-ACP methyl ester carboxylesterase
MRFLLIPFLVGVGSLGGSPPVEAVRESPRPLVILVHGRGQLGFDSAATRREWKRDLDSALAIVGFPRLRDEDVKLAWYADLLDPAVEEPCALVTRAANVDELGFGSIARGLLATIASAMSDSVESFGTRGLLGDVLFFVDRETRCAAEQRVASLLTSAAQERRPVIVVAYSLGSLVTYGYLRRAPGERLPADLRLITLGSPLGVHEIRDLVLDASADTLAAPPGLKSWDNIYDPDDFFAAPLRGKVAFRELRDHPTELASDGDVHYISRYLRDRSTGTAVARALCATMKSELGERCERI